MTLLTEELPDWASDGKLGIDLLFDSYSYNGMQAELELEQIWASIRFKRRLKFR